MPRPVHRTTNKIVKVCPYCGAKGPKELVQGEPKVNWLAFWMLLLCTCAIGLLAVSAWYKSRVEAYCEHCQQPFVI